MLVGAGRMKAGIANRRTSASQTAEQGGDQQQAQQESSRPRRISRCPPPRVERRADAPHVDAELLACSSRRGCAGAAGRRRTSSPMRPGRGVITSTRSARNTASVVEWVMNSTVLRRSIQMRCSSTFMVSRVMRVERAERLVHQQQRRIVDQRAHQRDALLHAAGQLPRIAVLEAGEADQRRAARARAASSRSRPSRCTSTGSSTLPSTLRQGNSTGDWNTTPMSRRGPVDRRAVEDAPRPARPAAGRPES